MPHRYGQQVLPGRYPRQDRGCWQVLPGAASMPDNGVQHVVPGAGGIQGHPPSVVSNTPNVLIGIHAKAELLGRARTMAMHRQSEEVALGIPRKALPVLLLARSPSPFLRVGESRGRSPTPKEWRLHAPAPASPTASDHDASYPPLSASDHDKPFEYLKTTSTKTHQEGQALPATESGAMQTRKDITPTSSLEDDQLATRQQHDTGIPKAAGHARHS